MKNGGAMIGYGKPAVVEKIVDDYFIEKNVIGNKIGKVRDFFDELGGNRDLEKVFIQILMLFPPNETHIRPDASTNGFLAFYNETPIGEIKPVFSIVTTPSRIGINLAHNTVPRKEKHREYLLRDIGKIGLPIEAMQSGKRIVNNCVRYSEHESAVSINLVDAEKSYRIIRFLAGYLDFFEKGDWL